MSIYYSYDHWSSGLAKSRPRSWKHIGSKRLYWGSGHSPRQQTLATLVNHHYAHLPGFWPFFCFSFSINRPKRKPTLKNWAQSSKFTHFPSRARGLAGLGILEWGIVMSWPAWWNDLRSVLPVFALHSYLGMEKAFKDLHFPLRPRVRHLTTLLYSPPLSISSNLSW